ncbi:MAG: CapA family protein [Victivallaceae bacterium]|jgi:hypothetical protein
MNLDTLFKSGIIAFDNSSSSSPEWTFSAAGDYGILPEPGKLIAADGGKALAGNIRKLTEADFSIVNLEIALTGTAEVSGRGVRGDREIFMNFQKLAPFSAYSLANNHIRDAGAEALLQTIERFNAESIRYVGAGRNQAEAEAPLFAEMKGVKLGILAFAQNENQIADSAAPGAAELLADKVIAAAGKLVGQCAVPVVIMHEGFEFMDFPRTQFKDLCHKLAGIGVKLVIGHHSHVPQGIEKIGDTLIFYSLGNFLFDQSHFAPYPWSRKSFVPVIKFKGDKLAGLEIRPLTIELNPLQVRPASADECAAMLDHLKANCEIIADDALLKNEMDKFFTNILLPEFFGYLQRYGNENKGDFSEMIQRFKKQVTVHKLFSDFLSIYSVNNG